MVALPVWGNVVVHVAVLFCRGTLEQLARAVVPFVKLTVPVASAGVTVAVSTMLCPGATLGLATLTVTVGLALATINGSVPELATVLESPL